jgi:hypothetical protein
MLHRNKYTKVWWIADGQLSILKVMVFMKNSALPHAIRLSLSPNSEELTICSYLSNSNKGIKTITT